MSGGDVGFGGSRATAAGPAERTDLEEGLAAALQSNGIAPPQLSAWRPPKGVRLAELGAGVELR